MPAAEQLRQALGLRADTLLTEETTSSAGAAAGEAGEAGDDSGALEAVG